MFKGISFNRPLICKFFVMNKGLSFFLFVSHLFNLSCLC
nr:MAG TPA: hypothetical protein [Caudoviricetes sp.]